MNAVYNTSVAIENVLWEYHCRLGLHLWNHQRNRYFVAHDAFLGFVVDFPEKCPTELWMIKFVISKDFTGKRHSLLTAGKVMLI